MPDARHATMLLPMIPRLITITRYVILRCRRQLLRHI